ncbi:hypothetical protein AB5I41_04785 [Sphingomonas sp. MMS24-JH45]
MTQIVGEVSGPKGADRISNRDREIVEAAISFGAVEGQVGKVSAVSLNVTRRSGATIGASITIVTTFSCFGEGRRETVTSEVAIAHCHRSEWQSQGGDPKSRAMDKPGPDGSV